MHQLVVPIGYMGSGSSVITDLVSEFRGYEARNDTFEYVFLHCPNGVFDLEDKLLIGNNALRSDEALHSFLNTMRQLYDKKWWWVGDYQQRVGVEFWDCTKTYINKLVQYTPTYYWYIQEKTNIQMFFKLAWKRIVSLLTFHKVNLKKPLLYSPMWISFIQPDEFYEISRVYIQQILKLMGIMEQSIILDQLLLPHNLYRVDHYFGDELRAIVVSRDPRDVFIINKYIWSKQNMPVPYPTDVKEFCGFYKGLRESEKYTQSNKVLRIHFEDLVYDYENSVNQILEFLNLDSSFHTLKKTYFLPERSINNTQLFQNERYKEETKIITDNLSDYLYPFPYARVPVESQTF